MEFLNQYEVLKQGLEARKQTIKENIAAAKTTQTGIIDQVAAKKEEYRKTLNVELLKGTKPLNSARFEIIQGLANLFYSGSIDVLLEKNGYKHK